MPLGCIYTEVSDKSKRYISYETNLNNPGSDNIPLLLREAGTISLALQYVER